MIITEAVGGAALLARGFGVVAGRRRLFLLGALPPVITSVIFLALLITMISNLDRIIPEYATWIRVLIGIGATGGSILIMVLVFTAITLAVGGPAYEKISELVEAELGAAPDEVTEPAVRSIGRSVGQSIALLLVSLAGAIVFALLGLIPVVGQTVVPVLSAIFGAWMLCIELIGTPFQRRGLRTVAERRQAMRAHRLRTLGFAVPTFLLLAIPFVSILVFPAAAAGGTMLARDLLEEDHADC
ncbi:MAG: EI24 domain-containing protein [Microlunatus sp.]|nr:EI24 domain-containing protein [Microlunatus sp.]